MVRSGKGGVSTASREGVKEEEEEEKGKGGEGKRRRREGRP